MNFSEVRQKEVLEKHVKMVENKQNITEVNGKKVSGLDEFL